MQIELDSEKTYRGIYLKDGKNYFSFFKKHDDKTVIDIITNNIINFSDFISLEHQVYNSAIKYYKQKYNKNKNLNIFEVTEISESYILTHILKVLRFFKIDYEEIKKESNDKEIFDKVCKKWYSYVKRYFPKEDVDIYIEQIKKFKNIMEILSFSTFELNELPIIFWHEYAKSLNEFKWDTFSKLMVETANMFNYSLYDIVYNKDYYRPIFQAKKLEIKNKLLTDYKNLCNSSIKEKLIDAKNTLEKELKEATEISDEDLVTEINIIKEEIKKIESTIFQTIKNLPDDITTLDKTNDFWPVLLYPIPDVRFNKNQYYGIERLIDLIKND